MRRLTKTISLIISCCFIAACFSPIGTIEKDESVDDFWLVSRRQVYNVGDDFNKNNDLWAFTSDRGIVNRISAGDVTLKLISDPNSKEPKEYPITDDTLHLINGIGTGRKIIEATYGVRTAEYSIEILDPYKVSDPDAPPAGDGESGFEVVWKKS